jgi:hypothetical protein
VLWKARQVADLGANAVSAQQVSPALSLREVAGRKSPGVSIVGTEEGIEVQDEKAVILEYATRTLKRDLFLDLMEMMG